MAGSLFELDTFSHNIFLEYLQAIAILQKLYPPSKRVSEKYYYKTAYNSLRNQKSRIFFYPILDVIYISYFHLGLNFQKVLLTQYRGIRVNYFISGFAKYLYIDIENMNS